jgi:molecular chaperone DnaK
VESAISDLRTALKGDDKAAIDKKLEALMSASGGIAQQAQAAQQGAGAEGAGGAGAGADASGSKGNDDAVDAEFEEVKDNKKKAS